MRAESLPRDAVPRPRPPVVPAHAAPPFPPDPVAGAEALPPAVSPPAPAGASQPVFADLSGRRRRRMRLIGLSLGAAMAAFLVVMALGLTGGPQASFIPWSAVNATTSASASQGTKPSVHARRHHHTKAGTPGAAAPSVPPSPQPSPSPAPSPSPSPVSSSSPTPVATNPGGKTPRGHSHSPSPHSSGSASVA